MKHTSSTAALGIIANPASGRDIRRLTSRALVFPTVEKVNMIERLLGAFAATGVQRVLMMPDLVGIAAGLLRAIEGRRGQGEAAWPEVEFLEMPLTDSALDTVRAVERMRAAGVAAIVVLGGDGTHRIVAGACGDTPLATLSSGTNNAFPDLREATLTGLAAGLFASGAVSPAEGLVGNKRLRLRVGEREELALVEVCVTRLEHVGARAVWDPASIAEVYAAFAEPDAIGLSSIVAGVSPVGRRQPQGAWVHCGGVGAEVGGVWAPIAPGLVVPVPIAASGLLQPDQPVALRSLRGSVALDGEREIELDGRQVATLTLELDGPRSLDVPATLGAAIRRGALRYPAAAPLGPP